MMIYKGSIKTYKAEEDITGAINNKLNAVKLAIIGGTEGTIREATEDANKFQVRGAFATIGPGSTVPWVIGIPDEADVNEGDTVGILENGVTSLILLAGEVVEDGDLLQAAEDGKVSVIAISATATDEELESVIATARVDVALDAVNDQAVEAKLLI